ncbi:exonuclease SbcC [Actinacidiphila alni]|uniref:Nuclease SbcCD subunit C n=1 Tax=Actinacidiphila alni TaxID=380248 RepID=A0A1I2B1I3_9ACTN|nr:AAA family ATPase [Actinacidiphila alni]SFE49020.1 exonuclease SbcC [Actinacidiphila alni]
MRLHRLELTAFGPFAATQSVDFDELSAAGLFLLHGPTGAGKTSVLDGVCYALYGQVPGARPATRLRSDHAAAGTPTEVILELTVGARRLEITRRPEQPRAKKRGTGTTMDKAVTLLREHKDGQWQALSKSHQEIGEEIKQLVGMSCEQFCQVVLLPQGEFATFLRASAMERAALLGRLFDTRRFKAVENWLRERKQEAAERLAAGGQSLLQLAERMRQAAGGSASEAEDAFDAESPSPGGLLEWAAVLRCDAREVADIAGQALARAETEHRAAAADFDAARDLHTLQARHADARRRAAEVDRERETRAAARDRLARAHRAGTVEPALDLREKAALQHRDALAAEHAALADLRSSGELPPPTVPHDRSSTETRAERTAPAAAGAAPSDPQAAALRGKRDAGKDGSATSWAEASGGTPGPGDAASGVGAERDGEAGGPRSATGPAGRPVRADGLMSGPDGAAGGVGAERDGEAGGSSSVTAYAGDQVRLGELAPGPDGVAGGVGAQGDGGTGGSWSAAAPVGRGVRSVGLHGGPGAQWSGGTGASGDGRAAGQQPWRAEALVRRVGELREEMGGLARAGEAEARVREIAERRVRLEREERADEGAVRDADSWLEEWPAVRAALQARADGAAEAAAKAAGLAAELETARRRSDAAAQRDRFAAELTHAQDRARDVRDRAAQAREAWQDLRQARIDGIAAELAEQLADGEPCRVCGSAEHPAPARPVGRQITRADEDAAGAAYERAAQAHEAARREADRLAAALEAATATAGDEPRARLAAACAVLEGEHAAAAREAADLSEARRAVDAAEQERDRRTAQRHAAQSRTAARTSRREELDEQHRRLSAELDRARAGHASVAERRSRLAARITLLDRAAGAVRDRAESAQRLAEADAALAEAAARAGFATPADAEAALLDLERLWRAERQADAWAKEEAALEADLAAPEPAAAAQLPPAEPALAQAALGAATDRLRAASAAEAAAATRCAELDRLSDRAAALTRHLAPARADFDAIARLSDLASATTAQNRYRMELETYVLAARLEQVAAAAAVRLQRMSAGRYTLVHTDARGGGRSKSGLGLMVVDAWTGTERDTATLSGGETFFASLALALGLADVVTDEAGGARLDTLFIDEGFGSLDDQTLDEVLDVLDGLRERDRAVGIVSHVADLRHRIPAQLRVVKGRDGSTVRMRTGGTRAPAPA